ncbi:578_t:CDS:1, partial [Gigaspora margarita]
GLCKIVDNRKVLKYRVVQIDRERKVIRDNSELDFIHMTRANVILEALLIASSKSRVISKSDSSAAILLVKKVLGVLERKNG